MLPRDFVCLALISQSTSSRFFLPYSASTWYELCWSYTMCLVRDVFVIVRRGCLEKIMRMIFQATEQCSTGSCVLCLAHLPPWCYYIIRNYMYVFYSEPCFLDGLVFSLRRRRNVSWTPCSEGMVFVSSGWFEVAGSRRLLRSPPVHTQLVRQPIKREKYPWFFVDLSPHLSTWCVSVKSTLCGKDWCKATAIF